MGAARTSSKIIHKSVILKFLNRKKSEVKVVFLK